MAASTLRGTRISGGPPHRSLARACVRDDTRHPSHRWRRPRPRRAADLIDWRRQSAPVAQRVIPLPPLREIAAVFRPTPMVLGAPSVWLLATALGPASHGCNDGRPAVDLDPRRTTETDYLWERTPQSSWLLLDARTAMHPQVADSLEAHGYSRDRLSVKGSRYTLWRPPSP